MDNSLSLSVEVPEKLMTTKELATALNVSVDTIQKTIKKLQATSESFRKFKKGQTPKFNEVEVTAIKLELQNRSKVNALSPKTNLERQLIIQQAMQFLQENINELKAENELMKPKAEFYDKVTGSSDTCDMKEVAKILNFKGIGRNNLFEILRNENVLDRQNQPYQKYVDAGYFRIIESKWEDRDGDIHINLKTVVFQKGIEFIRKTVLKSNTYLSDQKVIEDTADKWLNPNPKIYCSCKAE
ncbi:MAG: phage antirepressor KilAC domain-containing protein [Methanobrevibacter sp.]|nr:phage antirepressor KilAC domain-containing protein [Methanobrevibacter sp.]